MNAQPPRESIDTLGMTVDAWIDDMHERYDIEEANALARSKSARSEYRYWLRARLRKLAQDIVNTERTMSKSEFHRRVDNAIRQ